jgi:ABC-type transporter Mla MlaB component
VAASFIKLVYTFTHLRIQKVVNGQTVHLHLDGAATFLRLPALAAAFESVPRSSELHVHVERLTHVDHAALEVIMGWERQATRAGGKLVMEWDEVNMLYKRARPVPELAATVVN